MPDCYTVQTMEVSVPVTEYLETCVDVETFLGFCRECSNYERRWSCPPFSFDPLDLWQGYRTLRIFARVLVASSRADLAGMLEGMKQEKSRLMQELLKLERTIPGALALAAGGCSLCGDGCTRSSGAPCRRPNEMRYSIDSLGGDLSKTMEQYFQKSILWIRDGKLPEYLTIVGGLLVREENR